MGRCGFGSLEYTRIFLFTTGYTPLTHAPIQVNHSTRQDEYHVRHEGARLFASCAFFVINSPTPTRFGDYQRFG